MQLAARVLVGVAGVKLAWMLLAVSAGLPASDPPAAGMAFGTWPSTFLALAYGGVGAFLLGTSAGSSRGWWLGGTLLLTAGPFGDAVLVRRVLTGWEPRVVPALAIDVFLPFYLWSFLSLFPTTGDERADRLASSAARLAAFIGVAFGVTNLAAHLVPADLGWLALSRRSVPYLAGVIGLAAAGLPYLWWKSQSARPSEATRVRAFTAGLVLGCGPLLVDVFASAVSPAYDRWAWRPDVVALRLPALFLALALVPLVTSYSVLVDRVVDLQVALRAAAQYALARYTLLALVSVPFVLLAVYLFQRRDEPLAALVTGWRVVFLVALIALATAALRQRRHWLRALDQRFFRDEADSAALVTRLVEHARAAATDIEVSQFVRRDMAEALHAEHAALLVAAPGKTALVDPEGRVPSLGYASSLVLLLVGNSTPFTVTGAAAQSVLTRLPAADRRWLHDAGFHVLVPLRRTPTSLAAVLALGPRRSGLPYTATHHMLLTAVAAAVSLALENHRLKSSPSGDDEEPAEECLTCGTLLAPGTGLCHCGGAVTHAPVPLVLRRAFRLEQRIGAGGMGVVYRASDLSLTRPVAIKTLPRVSATRAERLRDEARTMARLAHPHLATIHSVESWRGTPLLVVELLAGGTLADRLKSGPLPLAAVADLGLELADVLEHVHATDMVHCDIKPSNIGFTARGTLKLLDFGLTQWFTEARASPPPDPDTRDAITSLASGSAAAGDVSGHFAGTPIYMSPEALGAERPSPLFDLWSTAVVLYEALAGHHPFAGGSTDEVLGRIRRGECLGAAVLKASWPAPSIDTLVECLSPDRARRPASAGDLRTRLQRVKQCAAVM